MPLLVDVHGQPIRRRIGFLAMYVPNELSDSQTDAISTKTVMPEEPDRSEDEKGEPPQCR
jgi:hypothetical protein